MSEVKKCPKCGGEMVQISRLSNGHAAIQLSNGWLSSQGKVIPFCCQNCGYIELYGEKTSRRNKQ